MTSWQKLLKSSITDTQELHEHFDLSEGEISAVSKRYPMRINAYYLELIKQVGTPLFKQAVPDIRELTDPVGLRDPLNEEKMSPVPNLVHKYPDRVLFLVCSECAMYCRFCTRKRKVGRQEMVVTDDTIDAGLDYIAKSTTIREVLLSGGDPLLLCDERLEDILSRLRALPHVEVIRIGSRIPCTLPQRITDPLVGMLKKYNPLYINTHFNHPAELTPEAALACKRIADAGIPLGCQTVLLRGINDSPAIMRELFCGLLALRVKPYYLFQMDQTLGTDHFRTTIESGMQIMKDLIGHVSGMAIPTYALDSPGGGGKIPLTPAYIEKMGDRLEFKNYLGNSYSYPNTVDTCVKITHK